MRLASAKQLVYLNAQGEGGVTCPACANRFQIRAADYRNLHIPIRVTCTCDDRFFILLNTREFYRKDVWLPGVYAPLGSSRTQKMTAINLSLGGIHFYTMLPHTLQVDDMITLSFCLDNKQRSEICQKAVVRWARDKDIGAEFYDGKTYDSKLGFYLRT